MGASDPRRRRGVPAAGPQIAEALSGDAASMRSLRGARRWRGDRRRGVRAAVAMFTDASTVGRLGRCRGSGQTRRLRRGWRRRPERGRSAHGGLDSGF